MYTVIFLTFSCLYLYVNCSNSRAEYYETIIQEAINNGSSYKPPEDNSDIKVGLNSTTVEDFGHFDFIIIGAGSTGSVIATRLSEVQSWKILLLEAGSEETDITDIPAMQPHVLKSKRNWGYVSAPQKHYCSQHPEKRCLAPRGKSIGGTSTLNGVHYVRGNAADFDKWAELGNSDWSFEKVLPYFIKSENSQVNGDESYHGKDGYLNVEYQTPELETLSDIINAAAELGLKNVDYNGKQQIGIGKIQYTSKNGKRHSTGRAYLAYARRRQNLNLTTNAYATNIIIDNDTKKAKGVYFIKDDKKFIALADKEIILSAGAYNSPQLLMLSGIGPKEDLDKLGIKVLKDLPVGRNMIDHPAISFIFNINRTLETVSLRDQIDQYLTGTGPLTKTSSADVIAFINLNETSSTIPTNGFLFSVKENAIFILPMVQHPKSRGTVTLKSSSPIDFPVIDPNLLSDANNEDRDNIYKCINFVFNLSETKAFKQLNATFIVDDACGPFHKESRSYWDCYLKQMDYTATHSLGTTRMGSVVDQNLNVFGIKSLRVADAGVIPTSTSGHTNAVVIMIGEKISDKIKTDYGQSKNNSNSVKCIFHLLIALLLLHCIIA